MAKLDFGVIDSETDPFEFGKVPQPFAWEILMPDGEIFVSWGKSATLEVVEYLKQMPKRTLYAHNAGKFDAHFLIPFCEPQDLMIINGRIAKLRVGLVTIVDSYLLVPIALEQYRKTAIDYGKFTKANRAKHKKEILSYLHDDCRYLLELMQGMVSTLGKKLTIGAAAMKSLEGFGYDISRQTEAHDDKFRPFYFGGRVEAIERGYWKKCGLDYVDINSAYPHAMTLPHPFGNKYTFSTELPEKLGPQFLIIDAVSRGALPIRDGIKLQFPRDNESREYYVTGWEVAAGLETGTLDIKRVRAVYTPAVLQSYEKYVAHHYAQKSKCKKSGDKIGELTAKLLLNSAYGKFATDPANHLSYHLEHRNTRPADHWDFEFDIEGTDFTIWSEPAERREYSYYDVSIAASITGAVRAKLWRAMCAVKRPLYCDTDSLICADASALQISDKLGEWKHEGRISSFACAGRKLYAARVGKEWKTACKGARIGPEAIIAVARGETVLWENQAPTFSLSKGTHFVSRCISMQK